MTFSSDILFIHCIIGNQSGIIFSQDDELLAVFFSDKLYVIAKLKWI